jgi:hypothetical protein
VDRLTGRTAALLRSALVGASSDPPEPRLDRPSNPDHPLVAPEVAGSSPVGHPLRFRIGKANPQKRDAVRCSCRAFLTPPAAGRLLAPVRARHAGTGEREERSRVGREVSGGGRRTEEVLA